MRGSGWAFTLCQTYGLTYLGISKIISLLKVEITVADTFDALKRASARSLKDQVIITDRGLLQRGEVGGHALSLFLQKKDRSTCLFIGDSEGRFDGTLCAKFKSILPGKLQCIASVVKRQPAYEATCNAFAIEDGLAFLREPDLLDQIKKLNGFSGADLKKEILLATRLPRSLMHFSRPEETRLCALKYQTRVINSVQKETKLFGPELRALIVVLAITAFALIIIFKK